EKAARLPERPLPFSYCFLPQERADHLLHQQGARVDLVEITVAVIIIVARVEVVLLPDRIGTLPEAVAPAIEALPALPARELFRLAGRHAAIVLLGEPRRAAADAVAKSVVAVAMSVTVTVAGAGKARSGGTERRGAGDEEDVFHSFTISDL